MRHLIPALAVALLFGCEPDADDIGAGAETTAPSPTLPDPTGGPATATDPTPTTPTTEAPAAQPCTGEPRCLVEGHNAFASNGVERDVVVRLPADPVGAPVVFVWHWLHSTPDVMLDALGTEQLLDAGYVIVAPQSTKIPDTDWDIWHDDGNVDLALFDELLAQLELQYAIDADRVGSTGFSAGGLFDSWLTMYRGDVLNATVTFSGGIWGYHSPGSDTAAMVVWGGPEDIHEPTHFDQTSLKFADSLAGDGHEVTTCVHDDGHELPPDAQALVVGFLDAHASDPFGYEADPTLVPSWCTLVE